MAERHDEQLLGFATLDKIFPIIDTVDSLDSDVRVRPLAARQGKVLREMIEAIQSFTIEIVDSLPGAGQSGIIYLVLDPLSTEDTNKYNEFVWIATTSSYEKLGSFTTNIDLSDYATVEQLNNALQRYQEKLVSGTNIKTINNQSLLGTGNISIESGSNLPEGGITGQVLKKTASGVEWANDNDTTYNKATQQADGLMSKEDKTKLDNITTAYASIMTQAEYDELSPKEENRIYYIKG